MTTEQKLNAFLRHCRLMLMLPCPSRVIGREDSSKNQDIIALNSLEVASQLADPNAEWKHAQSELSAAEPNAKLLISGVVSAVKADREDGHTRYLSERLSKALQPERFEEGRASLDGLS